MSTNHHQNEVSFPQGRKNLIHINKPTSSQQKITIPDNIGNVTVFSLKKNVFAALNNAVISMTIGCQGI